MEIKSRGLGRNRDIYVWPFSDYASACACVRFSPMHVHMAPALRPRRGSVCIHDSLVVRSRNRRSEAPRRLLVSKEPGEEAICVVNLSALARVFGVICVDKNKDHWD